MWSRSYHGEEPGLLSYSSGETERHSSGADIASALRGRPGGQGRPQAAPEEGLPWPARHWPRYNAAEKGECDIKSNMVRVLKEAMDEAATLPEADQEEIGRDLLSYVERLRRLRAEIDKGIRSLDAGEGSELDIEGFIRQSTQRHGGA
jgi:hypothetical protein